MVRWWRFNQSDGVNDGDALEAQRWSQVMPGDSVQSRGTMALDINDLPRWEDPDIKIYRLATSPVLVLSRHPDSPVKDTTTFVCLSRHGLIAVITSMKEARSVE